MAFKSVARTHVGSRRKLNEDSYFNSPERGVWAVADGMGGHESGEVASALVVELLESLSADESLASRTLAARVALAEANRRLVALAQGSDMRRTIGTTAVVLLADASAFSCLWAGDSRAYRLRDGQLIQLTQDHSLVQQLVDAGEISPAEANTHPNANVITRAVGASSELKVDIVHGELLPGDLFLLASDGLTRPVCDEDLLAALQNSDLDLAADSLVAKALDRGGPDNIALIIVTPG